jgi:hypothetical protein
VRLLRGPHLDAELVIGKRGEEEKRREGREGKWREREGKEGKRREGKGREGGEEKGRKE